MRKLLLFLLLIASVGVYAQSQTSRFKGETEVCPNVEYVYTYTFKSELSTDQDINIRVEGGRSLLNVNNFSIKKKKGDKSISFSIKWDDRSQNGNSVEVDDPEGWATLSDIYVATFTGTSASDFGNYGFKSSPAGIGSTIRIPYMQIGTLTMSVSPVSFLKCKKAEYQTSVFDWTIGNSQTIRTGTSNSIEYGAVDLDGTVIKVAPVSTACSRINVGSSAIYRIERYLNPTIQVDGDKVICLNENKIYQLNNIPAGAKVEWTTGENSVVVSGQGTTKVVIKSSRNGYINVKANVTYGTKAATTSNQDVWAGAPEPDIDPGTSRLDYYTTYTVYAKDTPGGTLYNWTLMGNAIFDNGSYFITTTTNQVKIHTQSPAEPGMGELLKIRCTVINKCGTGFASKNLMFRMVPLKNERADGSSLRVIDGTLKVSVNIYSLSGKLVFSANDVLGDFNINTTALSDGIYIIEKSDGKTKSSEKVVLKR